MSLKAVVFDVGGVLYDWHPRFLYEKLIDDSARLERFLAEVVTLEWHFQHDAGRDFAETSVELIERHPEYAELISLYRDRFNETNRAPIPGMHELLRELDTAGVPLFAITNFSHEFYPPFAALHAEIFDRFREVVVSGAEKLTKPDPAIYALALKRFGLQPNEGIFIDDNLANAEAAAANGFIGHHFAGDVEALREQMRGMRLIA